MAQDSEARVVVSGYVQGVFFRASTRDVAVRFGVRGYVRNLPDGGVEAVLQGDRHAILHVIAFLQAGPPGARVETTAIDWRTPMETYDGFTVRR